MCCIAIEKYCDGNPNDVVAHSLIVPETYERKLGSHVELKCKDYYLPVVEGSNPLEAICKEFTAEKGIWIPTGHCACKGSEGYVH